MTSSRRPSEREEAQRQFLAAYDAAQYPHPSVTVDVVLLTVAGGALRALLVERQEQPESGKWSLPGGFVRMDESLDAAAARVLAEKAVLEGLFLEQLYTFGAPRRDPRTRVITVAYYALIDAAQLGRRWESRPGVVLAALHVPWRGERGGLVEARNDAGQPLPLAFDHAAILGVAVKRLRGKLAYAPLGFELLPPRFTLRDLQSIHETILGRALNKDSFRRSMLASGLIVATGARETAVGHRPAELYRFRRKPTRD